MPWNTVKSTSFPLVTQAGGMPAEGVTYDYDSLRRPTKTTGLLSSYVTNSTYSLTGKPEQYELSTGGKKTWLTYSYEYGTQRLAEARTERENIAGVDRDAKYAYNDAGNLTSIPDTQCFRYDYLQRLTDAWTPTGGCAADPAKDTLGGPAPYWTSYSYDVTGNRTGETDHGTTAVAADTTRNYHYPDPGKGQHQLTSVTQTGAAGARTDDFGYDADGNTTSRQLGTAAQTLTWDEEGLWGSKTLITLRDLRVFVDQAAEDLPAGDPCVLDVRHAGARFWCGLSERSVGAVLVVVLGVFGEHGPQVAFAEDRHSVGAFAAGGARPAFGDRVGPRCLRWRLDDFDAG